MVLKEIHNGVIVSLFTGAIIKRILVPLQGNLDVIISREDIENIVKKVEKRIIVV